MQVLINLLQFSELETRLETRTTELISCKEEIASLKVRVFPEKCLFKATDSDLNSVFSNKNFETADEIFPYYFNTTIWIDEIFVSLHFLVQNSQSEENEELKRLRADRSRLEDRVLEKERSLKLHQQRLNDMKKTLQKEMVIY